MKCAAASASPSAALARSQKYCLKMLGSSVLPDLLETINSVRSRSIVLSRRRIWAGSVESRTCKRGKPELAPKLCASTSGPRLEPPMPSSTASLNPAFLTSAAKLSRRPAPFSSASTRLSQPSHCASSVLVRSEEHTSELQSPDHLV